MTVFASICLWLGILSAGVRDPWAPQLHLCGVVDVTVGVGDPGDEWSGRPPRGPDSLAAPLCLHTTVQPLRYQRGPATGAHTPWACWMDWAGRRI